MRLRGATSHTLVMTRGYKISIYKLSMSKNTVSALLISSASFKSMDFTMKIIEMLNFLGVEFKAGRPAI
jgi:hypothetical protein